VPFAISKIAKPLVGLEQQHEAQAAEALYRYWRRGPNFRAQGTVPGSRPHRFAGREHIGRGGVLAVEPLKRKVRPRSPGSAFADAATGDLKQILR
jgi:hypothetical protein